MIIISALGSIKPKEKYL